MKKFRLLGKEIFSWGEDIIQNIIPDPRKEFIMPAGRVSKPELQDSFFDILKDDLRIVNASFQFDVIKIIRKLVKVNPDISQSLDNIIQLGNTGHELVFDKSVGDKKVFEMRRHLMTRKLDWSEGTSGMDGLINKMFSQIMISGALSNEWIPKIDLSGIKKIALINPENIRFAYENKSGNYIPLQKTDSFNRAGGEEEFIKLNTNTYKYYALNGDEEIPYGFPPFLAALDSISIQRKMMDSIKFIVGQIGLMGFLSVLMDKPSQRDDENDTTYKTRLENLLSIAKKPIQDGFRDGVMVGYKDDHEFDFHSTTKNVDGVDKLFTLNELQTLSGLKMDSSLLGRPYGTTETQITVIFTKLLAQLKNIQNIVKRNLEFGYALELRLAGFEFETLEVKFNPATPLDQLKAEQTKEIKIRNLNQLRNDGIISQQQYAEGIGFEKPHQKENNNGLSPQNQDAIKKREREKQKDSSDRKVREKNRPQKRTLMEEGLIDDETILDSLKLNNNHNGGNTNN